MIRTKSLLVAQGQEIVTAPAGLSPPLSCQRPVALVELLDVPRLTVECFSPAKSRRDVRKKMTNLLSKQEQ